MTTRGALRALTRGGLNDLFGGSDARRERATAIYSLVGTAKLNCVPLLGRI
jgi:hypothetical protein